VLACPAEALRLEDRLNGYCYLSDTPYGPMAHARLIPAGESSGRLVTRVRQIAEETASRDGRDLILIDGPPGIGCTAVASLTEVDLAVIVTEPTLSGVHDMERVIGLGRHFRVPLAIVINKADLNEANRRGIRRFADEHQIPVLAEVPFDESVMRAIAAQSPPVLYCDGPVSQGINAAWAGVVELLTSSCASS